MIGSSEDGTAEESHETQDLPEFLRRIQAAEMSLPAFTCDGTKLPGLSKLTWYPPTQTNFLVVDDFVVQLECPSPTSFRATVKEASSGRVVLSTNLPD